MTKKYLKNVIIPRNYGNKNQNNLPPHWQKSMEEPTTSRRDVEKREPFFTVGGIANWEPTMETVENTQKLKSKSIIRPRNTIPGIGPMDHC